MRYSIETRVYFRNDHFVTRYMIIDTDSGRRVFPPLESYATATGVAYALNREEGYAS